MQGGITITQQTLTIRQDQTPITAELTARNEREWLNEEGRELRENRPAEHLLHRVEARLLFHCPEILANHLAPNEGGTCPVH